MSWLTCDVLQYEQLLLALQARDAGLPEWYKTTWGERSLPWCRDNNRTTPLWEWFLEKWYLQRGKRLDIVRSETCHLNSEVEKENGPETSPAFPENLITFRNKPETSQKSAWRELDAPGFIRFLCLAFAEQYCRNSIYSTIKHCIKYNQAQDQNHNRIYAKFFSTRVAVELLFVKIIIPSYHIVICCVPAFVPRWAINPKKEMEMAV